MIDEQTKIITDTMSVWAWHLLGWMFFLKSLGFLVVREWAWFGGLVGCFLYCEIVALRRKWRLESST